MRDEKETTMKIKTIASVALAALTISSAFAQNMKFTVGNAGGMKVSQVFSFDSDADFENFTGQTHKVSGSINFDPKSGKGGGRIVVDIASIDTGIALRNEHLRSDMWFNAGKHPQAVFEATSVKRKTGDKYEVVGKLTLHGVTKTIKTEATAKYIKESEATRKAMFKGDVVNVKTAFQIKLADFGVMIPGMAKGKVAETINVKLNVFGYTG